MSGSRRREPSATVTAPLRPVARIVRPPLACRGTECPVGSVDAESADRAGPATNDGYAAVNVNTVDRRRLDDGEEVESESATERRSDTFGVDPLESGGLGRSAIGHPGVCPSEHGLPNTGVP